MEQERIQDFIRSFGAPEVSDALKIVEEEAKKSGVPIIRPQTRALLRVLLRMKKPERILEVGSAIGFSSVFMAEYTPYNTRIDTIENYLPRIKRARENIRMAGQDDKIRLLEGDAMEILPQLHDKYAFVFMDAAKGQYIHFLPDILRLLEPGGVLVSDNVLQDGDIFQSRYAIRRRNHTIHKRMREYLYALTHHELLETVILETGDGMTVSVRRED